MSVTVLQHPVAQSFLLKLRNIDTRTNESYRNDLHRVGVILAIEATKDLETMPATVKTPIRLADGSRPKYRQALVPITRSGNGFLGAFLQFLPNSLVWHVNAARDEKTFETIDYGNKIPETIPETVDVNYVLDPMLATGNSMCFAIQKLKNSGAKKIRAITLLCAPEGLARVQSEHPDVEIFTISVDSCLNEMMFIDPGLGDAGDLQFPTM